MVFYRHADLTARGPETQIAETERGELFQSVNEGDYWTGTNPDGSASTFDCEGWSNRWGINGLAGIRSTTSEWTARIAMPCSLEFRLLCFEQ